MELLFERALLPTGIARDVAVHMDDDGTLRSVDAGAQPDSLSPACVLVPGLAVCGMPNLHSHAFQRGIAGTTEVAATAENSFWGWREAMYRFVARLEPADVEAIAALAYVEMLEAGYTSVAEFHYLHHQADGRPYPDGAAMSAAVRNAANATGMRQLLLPCLYQASGFGPLPVSGGQHRFVYETRQFLELFEQLHAQACAHGTGLHTTGVALHSLRAVPIGALREVIAALPAGIPIHIHIAEQRREVEECLTFSGRRPIEYLLEQIQVDQHWCLVHATHATPTELQAIRQVGAVVGVCSTTEANLGDGCFPLDDFVGSGGRFGIGSDSQVSIDPREELRAAEYALRLLRQRRVLVCHGAQPHCGTSLYSLASSGGAQALGLNAGRLVAGAQADIVVIDTNQAQFAGIRDDALLDAHVFAPRPGSVRDVLVAGRWVVRDGRHAQREFVMEGYRRSLARLLQ